MGLGVLEDHKLSHVPGTATLEDLDPVASLARGNDTSRLKKSKKGVILVPQPSDDPKDPLNWPLWKRDIICGVLCLMSVIASTLSPLLAANTLTLTLHFGRSFTDIALLTGWHLLGVGLAGFCFVASARVWGKRHLYIIGTVIIIISSAWGGGSGKNYASLAAARFFQGVGLAPFEALVNVSVGELYFVHEVGTRMAFSNLCLFGGAFFTPVIVGIMTHKLGWEWTFYFIAIFTAGLLPLVVLYCPETAYVRDESFNAHNAPQRERDSDERSSSSHELRNNPTHYSESYHPEKDAATTTRNPSTEIQNIHHPSPFTFITRSNIALFNGRKSPENFFMLLIRPFPLFLHPSFLWACLIQGMMIGWTVLIGIVLAAIMLGAPLWFNEVETGYMYAGAFVGALVGFAVAGLMGDTFMIRVTKWNNGIYEPEFRMILVLPMLILGCAGLYGFGITGNDTWKYGWFWPDFFFGMEVAGMVLGAVASALYIVDAHRDLAIEGFTCLLIFKNIFSFGLTFSGYDWLVAAGIRPVFMAISSVQVVICLLTVPMYIFGKRWRSFAARKDLLGKLHLT
ncbi:putative major facilitator superfamily, MFS transporter superfamily [Septoria linicola]|nr:putative major facilitator superfamily, MFS transporter superfamily [Septoria linicola]